MKVDREFFERGVIEAAMNETYVYLIPKKEKVVRVKGYRPISLVTSLYKIIVKTLVDRLREKSFLVLFLGTKALLLQGDKS